jgi:type IV secretory pathway VirB9-like protein
MPRAYQSAPNTSAVTSDVATTNVRRETPPLLIIGPTGEAELVNYRVKGSTYIVDRLFAAAELRLGSNPQQTVRISRTDGR